ncbi:MAG: hypothetical protein RIS36_1909 [Pseudomonadota bacterium]|jgi:hypothetical protein
MEQGEDSKLVIVPRKRTRDKDLEIFGHVHMFSKKA